MHVTIDAFGDQVCEHGIAVDVHCCRCRRSGFFPPDDCDCYAPCPTRGESDGDARVERLRDYADAQEDA